MNVFGKVKQIRKRTGSKTGRKDSEEKYIVRPDTTMGYWAWA